MQSSFNLIAVLILATSSVARAEPRTDREPFAPASPALVQDASSLEYQKLEAYTQKYTREMRWVLFIELRTVQQSCDLAPVQRNPVRLAGEKALKQTSRRAAAITLDPAGRTPRLGETDYHQAICQGLVEALKKTVPAEQSAKYAEMSAQRVQLKKKAAVDSLLAFLDDHLRLSSDQREKISTAMHSNWQDGWLSLTSLQEASNWYIPELPGALILPHLSESQKEIWSKFRQIAVRGHSSHLVVTEADVDAWWTVPPERSSSRPVRKENDKSRIN
ncbi:MAG: hypothetical protein SGJ20_14600 [Planctomycetota bacterium]|nr:hypothetical protein [Planctomycetota bacterium]